MSDDLIPRLRPTLRALCEWFAATQTPYLVIGGVAVSLLARARTTRDIDAIVMVPEDAWATFLESGNAFGFVPRISAALDFALRARVLLLMHKPEGTEVDISLGALPFEAEAIAHGTNAHLDDIEVRLPRVEDMIVMKAVASRSIDLGDIESLMDVNPRVDLKRIRLLVAQFAEILETPEITQRLEQLLAARSKRRRPRKPRPK